MADIRNKMTGDAGRFDGMWDGGDPQRRIEGLKGDKFAHPTLPSAALKRLRSFSREFHSSWSGASNVIYNTYEERHGWPTHKLQTSESVKFQYSVPNKQLS